MFHLGVLAPEVEQLPRDVETLTRVVQGVIVHAEWLANYGLDASAVPTISRTTLPICQRLVQVKSDGRPLDEARAPAMRSIGTCRDFALSLCALLRATGTPARVRCGFAAYFGAGWEHHWLCEYWDQVSNQWALADAQLDPVMRSILGVPFEAHDVPRNAFLMAGEAWRKCRSAAGDSEQFGHGATKGLWFIGVNVVRDNLSLSDQVTSNWDTWREAPEAARLMTEAVMRQIDQIAEDAEGSIVDLLPFWRLSGSDRQI